VAHYIQDLHLVSVLDELRDAYELSKAEAHPELQPMLLQIRRKLLEALHESLNLYSENAELHQQLSEAQAQIRRLRAGAGLAAATTDSASGNAPRKLS
jgi:predicted nuclease with TOPRIM domain